jgi:hypothetical protein
MNGPFPPINGIRPLSFDQMRALAERDPGAFEAYRQASLSIALARMRNPEPLTKTLIMDLEKIMAPLQAEEKAHIAMRSMTLSLIQLNEVLQGLTSACHKA